jgi:hypothetical protein
VLASFLVWAVVVTVVAVVVTAVAVVVAAATAVVAAAVAAAAVINLPAARRSPIDDSQQAFVHCHACRMAVLFYARSN